MLGKNGIERQSVIVVLTPGQIEMTVAAQVIGLAMDRQVVNLCAYTKGRECAHSRITRAGANSRRSQLAARRMEHRIALRRTPYRRMNLAKSVSAPS